MTPAAKRQAIIDILTLFAKLNDEPEGRRGGARPVIELLQADKVKLAIEALRGSKNGVLSAFSWEVEAHLGAAKRP